MKFRQLDYQDRALATLDAYIEHLRTQKQRSDDIAELAADRTDLGLTIPDFTQEAWQAMRNEGRLPASRAAIPFSPRKDGCGGPVPNAVLKVPTGGGKTWLAVSGVSRIMGRYLERNTGFVLWIVPNEAIYRQTLKHLKDREHPYRQAIDRAAAGRVRIMEKMDRLDARDVESHLCVMLLMLQSANRETKETLKIFRDRGDVHGFFPPEGEQHAHRRALKQTRNLDAYGGGLVTMVKDSLGNALRVIRPVVVVDEGHRAISDLAFDTLYGFNPCFVLELTATPKDVKARGGKNPRAGRYANLLVEVTGRELDREGMIKIPLNLEPRQGTDWRATLGAALTKLNTLHAKADNLRADTNRYIRPIMLVQVERTGKDQRESGHIHAEDVRDWLLTMGFDEAEVAIKTAEQNDLNQPENQDLLSPTNRVRAIITKQALQEGWDCPFAYVLCALAASSGMTAMTQLVGRVLRQPGAERTGIKALDQCHVITHHAETKQVVEAIKKGLERDGLGDLHPLVSQHDATETQSGHRKIHRRPALASTVIYLPKVMVADNDQVRELDYEADVLSRIDWRGFDPGPIAAGIPENARAADAQLRRIELTEEGDVSETIAGPAEGATFDPVHVVRMMLDIVPNPFVGREIVERLLDALRDRGFDDRKLGGLAQLVVEAMRKGLDKERDRRAAALFKAGVEGGRIQFRLRLDGRDWQMPSQLDASEPSGSSQFLMQSGGPLQRSLFDPVYRSELNNDEQDVAVYLDGEAAVAWWHRNVARTQYGIQGWRKQKIYPDFIFAVREHDAASRIVVLETKGDHLDNLDTAYKREVLEFLSSTFAWADSIPAGQLELVADDGQTVECALILMSEWKVKLPHLLPSGAG